MGELRQSCGKSVKEYCFLLHTSANCFWFSLSLFLISMEKNTFAESVVTYPEALLICSCNKVILDTAAAVEEKATAPHSSTLAWQIQWMEEPGRLQSMGLLRVGHDWATSLSLFIFMHWRRKWQPTPVFLPGESQGQRSPVGCSLWGRTESDTTEVT